MCSDIAIAAQNLSKIYRIYDQPGDRLKQALWRGRRQYFREHEALKPTSFEIYTGETVGIIGRNGSGKSTLLQLVCGTLSPSSGNVCVNGRISALLELGSGFNPEFTGRENVFLNATILGLTEAEIKQRYDAIIAFSGLRESALAQPVKNYSSGMVVRLAFAVAVHTNPDILIVDEAMAVGDEAFQLKCFHKIKSIQESGATILFVSHDTNSVVKICNRALLLESGEMIAHGSPKRVISYYHKLIYAPMEKQPQIIEEIRSPSPETVTEAAIANTSAPQELAVSADAYIESLIPEGRTEYEPSGATLLSPHIENLQHQTVNLLTRGERYHYTYDAHFTEDAQNVGFGMMIRSANGLDIGGAFSAAPGKPTLPQVQAGQTVRVRFAFDVLLEPGTYYLNCGCIGDVGLKTGVFLHRITDAVMFKVTADRQNFQTGLIDFNIQPHAEIIS